MSTLHEQLQDLARAAEEVESHLGHGLGTAIKERAEQALATFEKAVSTFKSDVTPQQPTTASTPPQPAAQRPPTASNQPAQAPVRPQPTAPSGTPPAG